MPLQSLDTVGVQFVNVLLGRGVINGVVNLQFGTYQFTPVDDTQIAPDVVVSCRLRMDLECAQQLHTQLGVLLGMLSAGAEAQEAPATEKPN